MLNAHYDSADASETEKTVSFTIKLKNAGYVFEDGTTQKDFTLNGADFDDKTFQINKATIASDTQLHQTVFNDLAKTYEVDLNQVLDKILPEGGKYGDIIVAGFDAGAAQKNAVRNGWFYGSVTQDPYQIGYKAVEMAVMAAKGESVSDVDTGAQWYDASNIDDEMIAMLVYD